MPFRINGIGTTYIGRQNAHSESGVCESCHRAGALTSYETRLWFSVFFIPVIPLVRQANSSLLPELPASPRDVGERVAECADQGDRVGDVQRRCQPRFAGARYRLPRHVGGVQQARGGRPICGGDDQPDSAKTSTC